MTSFYHKKKKTELSLSNDAINITTNRNVTISNQYLISSLDEIQNFFWKKKENLHTIQLEELYEIIWNFYYIHFDEDKWMIPELKKTLINAYK